MDELIKLAKELPDGKGEDVIIGLGVGAWRGDEPEEEEFFRIIDSKFPRNGSRKGTRRGNLADESYEKVENEHKEALENVEKIADRYNLTLIEQSHGSTVYSRNAVSVDGNKYPYGKVKLRAWGYGTDGNGVIILDIWMKQSEFDFVGSNNTLTFDKNTSNIDIQSELDKLGLKFE